MVQLTVSSKAFPIGKCFVISVYEMDHNWFRTSDLSISSPAAYPLCSCQNWPGDAESIVAASREQDIIFASIVIRTIEGEAINTI